MFDRTRRAEREQETFERARMRMEPQSFDRRSPCDPILTQAIRVLPRHQPTMSGRGRVGPEIVCVDVEQQQAGIEVRPPIVPVPWP
jgi:hypothetical protein